MRFGGRRLWFAGIGGAGMSALAVVTRAWGAEVGGWDRVRTAYLERLEGVEVEISLAPPTPPEGWEVIVSSAFAAQVAGRPRGELLAEVVALGPSVVVAGAHGKTTTAAMIAFCLDRVGRDPSFLIGGDVPQLGGNARAGEGWLVAEGDESDRSLALLRPEIAVLTNIDLDHHAEFASRVEVEALFATWASRADNVVRGDTLEPVALELAVPGLHNRQNAACALAALELAGVAREEAERALLEFQGVGRRFELRGEAGGVVVYDDYGHNPAKVEAAIETARAVTGGRVIVVFQPHLYSRTLHTARELAAALARADIVCVTDVYAAREQPLAGVTGRLVVDALGDVRPGFVPGWTPTVEDAARFAVRHARAGDLVLTVGAGDVDRAAALVLEALS